MPGEATIAAAAAGWTGNEAVVFGGVVVALIGLGFLFWRHQSKCDDAMALLHRRISEVKDNVADLNAKVAVLVDRDKRSVV